MDFSSYLWVIRKYLWVIVLTTIIATGVFVLGARQRPAMYTATAKLRVMPFGVGATEYAEYLYFDRLVNTYKDIVHSDAVYDEVIRTLGMEYTPTYDLNLVLGTELMNVEGADTNPELAQQIANTTAQILVDRAQSLSTDSDWATQAILQDLISELDDEIKGLEEQRLELAQQAVDEEASSPVQGQILALGRMINTRQREYDTLLTAFDAETDEEIKQSLQSSMREIQSEIADLEEQQTDLESRADDDGNLAIQEQLTALDRTIEARQRSYDTLLDNYAQSLVQQASMAGAISFVSPASLPTETSSPMSLLIIALGMGVGLSGGTALAFLIETVSYTI